MLFRKILIRLGKVLPFLLAFIVAAGHTENLFACMFGLYECCDDGSLMLYTPMSDFIGNVAYVDILDVLLLYTLSIALEFCWRNMLAVHYLALNLLSRWFLESVEMENSLIIIICTFMALFGLYCVYGGIKMIKNQ